MNKSCLDQIKTFQRGRALNRIQDRKGNCVYNQKDTSLGTSSAPRRTCWSARKHATDRSKLERVKIKTQEVIKEIQNIT